LKNEYGGKTDDSEMKVEGEIKMPDLKEALRLAVKVLNKTMDATATTSDKLELFTMTFEDGECVHKVLSAQETQKVIDDVAAESSSAGDA
jgi:20S proteasome alpha/beta subunit